MNNTVPHNREECILVVAPVGRDAELASAAIERAGLSVIVCTSLSELIDELDHGCGVMLLAEEALGPAVLPRLRDYLDNQPAWSDIAIVLLTSPRSELNGSRSVTAIFGPSSNVTILERPLRVMTLTSALHSALRARRRQLQVRDLLQQREQVLASIQDAYAMIDHDWRFIYVNHQACELCQKRPDQLLGKGVWNLFPGANRREFETNLRLTMQERVPRSFEWRDPATERWFNVRLYPSDGGLALYSVEITERKRTELELERARHEAVEANLAKDQFLAALSHELRTPLNPVLMTVDSLRNDPDLPEWLRPQIEMIHRQVELEARLIDDLLDLTRITRDKLILCREVVDLHELIRHQVKTSFNAEALAKRLQLECHLEAGEHHTFGDPARLQQILWNLLNNAVKFTPPGGRITIRTRNTEAQAIEIEVADTGIGIQAEALPRLFDAFEQGNTGITRRFGGLGLGLAISKAVADLHNGSLSARSDGADKGSRFILCLGTCSPEDKLSVPHTPERSDPAPVLDVLLVEDHEPTRGVLMMLLGRAGHRVRATGTVAEALELAARHHFDIVVSDLGLPDRSGLELMRELRSRYGMQGIALSGFGMEEDVKASAAAGFYVHLTKPVDWGRLESTLALFVPEKAKGFDGKHEEADQGR